MMSELPDHDRIRKLLKRLDQIQRESEQIRERIENIRHESPEFPSRPGPSRLFDGLPDASAFASREKSSGSGRGER